MGLIPTPPSARAAIYARVSPKPEGAVGDNFSIASQLHEMKALALKKYGCADPDIYIDKDITGATLDRPDLDRLRDNIAQKFYDVVIAYSPDRWTRGGRIHAALLDSELAKGGAKLDFVSGSYDDTPEGRLSRKIQDDVSEYEREKLAERSRRCRRQKSRDGHPHSCVAPYGYKYEGHKFGKKGEYVKVEEEAKIVRVIFLKIAQGFTESACAKLLNELEIQTARGKRWSRNSISRIAARTAYYGELEQNGQAIRVPVIVPRQLWDKAREALERNKEGRRGRPPREYELSGLLWCARCGKRCGTFPGSHSPAYRCNNIDHCDRSVRYCFAPGIQKAALEAAVWNALWDTIESPGLLWQMVEAYHGRVAEAPKRKKDPAVARIDKARRALALAEKIFKDPDKPVSYEEAKADLEKAKRELAQAQIAGGAIIAEMPLRRDIEAVAARLRGMRHTLTAFEDRKAALHLLVEKIRYADGEAEIHCHLPAAVDEKCPNRLGAGDIFKDSTPFVINAAIVREDRSSVIRRSWEARRAKKRGRAA